MRTNEELINDYLAGNADALSELAKVNRGMIKAVATSWIKNRNDFDDAFQECSLAFLIAAHSFNPARGCLFSTFATTAMNNHMRNLKTKRMAKKRSAFVLSLNSETEGLSSLLSLLHAQSPEPVEIAGFREQVQFVRQRLRRLDRRTREIIWSRMRGYSRTEIGKKYAVSFQRIQQIEHKGMRQLRELCLKHD